MTSASAAERARRAFLECGFTADGVLLRVGSQAFAALGRGLTVPVARALSAASGPARTPDGTLDALITLFLLAEPVAGDALPADLATDLTELGLVRSNPQGIGPVVAVQPYGEPDTDWYLVSDLGAPTEPDHVLGLGGASLTLARITPRRDVGRVLDLGCGNGVQALHAARHASRVVATDTNPRALAMASLSCALSGIPPETLDLREGSLFAPVRDEQFDLIVSNPPFVISPSHRFTYRDAGLTGDELSRLVVRGAAAHLAPGGVAAVLANWLHVSGQEWADRVTQWVSGTGVSAWIVQRDEQSASDYAATWLRDGGLTEGPQFDEAMNEWLDVFADEDSDAVGFGWVVLLAPDGQRAESPWVLAEDLADSLRLPRGDEVAEFLTGSRIVESMGVPELLASPVRLADGVTITTSTQVIDGAGVSAPPRLGVPGRVGPGGWRGDVAVPPALLAALLSADPSPIGERLDVAAEDEGIEPLDVLAPALMSLRELIRVGIVRID